MSEFTDEYLQLLIKQYYDKPKASSEIVAKAESWELIRDVYASFPSEFDVDSALENPLLSLGGGFILGLSGGFALALTPESAIGQQQDIIGKIVGLDRGSLNDAEYQQLLKVKIAQNNASAFMVSDDRITIQDVIQLAFDGSAYVIDNKDMSLTLYIESPLIDPDFINFILDFKLLPKPQGVRYDVIANLGTGTPFGISETGEPDDTETLGLAELVYAPEDGGEVSELYV